MHWSAPAHLSHDPSRSCTVRAWQVQLGRMQTVEVLKASSGTAVREENSCAHVLHEICVVFPRDRISTLTRAPIRCPGHGRKTVNSTYLVFGPVRSRYAQHGIFRDGPSIAYSTKAGTKGAGKSQDRPGKSHGFHTGIFEQCT